MLTTGKYKQCTLYDLQTRYTVRDMYDLLEIQEVQMFLDEQAQKKAELERTKQSTRGGS